MRASATRWFSFSLAMLVGGFSASAATAGSALLDKVIREPGHWSQLCSGGPFVSFDAPIPLYSLFTPRSLSISEANCNALLKQRNEVVPEIVQRLRNIDLANVSVPKPEPRTDNNYVNQSGADPNQLSEFILEAILKLDAAETLPELLRLEEDLNQRLASATNGNLSAVPYFPRQVSLVFPSDFGRSGTGTNELYLFGARVVHRELLSVMMALVRSKQFQPMLDSEFETAYHSYLEREAKSPELRDIKTPKDIPPENTRWISFDPIYKIPVHPPWTCPTIPYSPEMRLEIRRIVTDYLKSAGRK